MHALAKLCYVEYEKRAMIMDVTYNVLSVTSDINIVL